MKKIVVAFYPDFWHFPFFNKILLYK